MKIYIAGPMRGIPYYNFPAFDKAAKMLRDFGYTVASPAEMDRAVGSDPKDLPPDFDWNSISDDFDIHACLIRDVEAVYASDAIYLLLGWKESTGVKMEKAVAEFLGRKVIYAGTRGDMELVPDNYCVPMSQAETNMAVANTTAQVANGQHTTSNPPPPLPTDSAERKTYPLFRGLFEYFPNALAAVAHHSYVNNEKHNPGEPIHWSRGKSDDHEDCVLRHTLEGTGKVARAWRALAALQIELEELDPTVELAVKPKGDTL